MCSWDIGTYKKIKRLSDEEARNLYNHICRKNENVNFDEIVDKLELFFLKELNLDRNLEQIKKA